MIATMDQLTVVGRRDIAREVMQSLQSLGVVHVDPLDYTAEPGLARVRLEGEDLREESRWQALHGRSSALLEVLTPHLPATPARAEAPASLDEAESWLRGAAAGIDALVAERGDAVEELQVISDNLPVFRLVAPLLARLEESRYLTGTAVLIGSSDSEGIRTKLTEALDGRVEFASREFGRDEVLILATVQEDDAVVRQALSRLGLARLELPLRYRDQGTAKAVHVMEERSQSLPRRLASIDEELSRLATSFGAKLHALNLLAGNQYERFQTMSNLSEGQYSFALRGWVPSESTRKVIEGLRKQFGDDIIAESRTADAHHDHAAPTKLVNSGWARPFELLLSLFDPPRYGAFDPTWTVAVFFPLYFGIVVGDFGFGLGFLLLGLWLRSRGLKGNDLSLGPLGITLDAATLPRIGVITIWCAVWSIIWGVVYGEFFGNFLEYWPASNPIFYVEGHGTGMFEVLLFRVEVFQPLLILTLGFGVLQVIGGWVVRAYYGYLHGDRKHLFEGIGMAAGLAGLVLFAYGFLTDSLGTGMLIASGIGLGIFVICVAISGVVLMLVELISNSGHILSYLRLFAVGLSAALVANLSTALGMAVAGAIPVPVLSALLGIAVALFVHLLAIALTIIGHTLQPLRLQYVEFFTKFGFYEHPGRAYKPFRLLGGKA